MRQAAGRRGELPLAADCSTVLSYRLYLISQQRWIAGNPDQPLSVNDISRDGRADPYGVDDARFSKRDQVLQSNLTVSRALPV